VTIVPYLHIVTSASGLGKACVEEICKAGGNVAILDMNEDNGKQMVIELSSSAKFFVCDVLRTESIASAIQGAVDWSKETSKPLRGVISAAGVATPATVGGTTLQSIWTECELI
jgi:NAD(P)-dependent dehydrogenase (short-subunit alcohol dehydrogenase family)